MFFVFFPPSNATNTAAVCSYGTPSVEACDLMHVPFPSQCRLSLLSAKSFNGALCNFMHTFLAWKNRLSVFLVSCREMFVFFFKKSPICFFLPLKNYMIPLKQVLSPQEMEAIFVNLEVSNQSSREDRVY